MALRDRILGTRWGYTVLRKAIRADRGMQTIVNDHLRPQPDQTIIDLGCGTGDLATMLPASVTYIGIDHNDAYLSPTQLSAGGGIHFVNADLGSLEQVDLPAADLAVAIGVLHHLPDDAVRSMLTAVKTLLKPGGRIVTVDPVFSPQQRSSARIMMALDRGRYVRHPEHYEHLFGSVFEGASATIRHDINPFPYSHCILAAVKPAATT